jgi:heme/copper-type cytochrome/quinol oxidase subunit 2
LEQEVRVRKSRFERTLGVLILIIVAIPAYGAIYWYDTQRYPLVGGDGETKVFYVTALMWEYYPQNITVKEGDHVIIHMTSVDAHHGAYLEAWNKTIDIFPNQTATIEFTAEKIGEFEYYCTVYCGIGHWDMKGYVKVEERDPR